MKRPVAFLIVACIAVSVVLGAACKKKEEATAGPGGRKGMRQAFFPVETMQVALRPNELIITAPGQVDAFEQIQVTARVAGVLDKITFTEGQEVKKGQVLAFIDSRRYALSVSQARAALAKAQATSADVEASLKRREAAIANNPGLITGEELETFKTKLRTANADVDAYREALNIAQLNLSDSSVRALSEGVIQTRNVQTGQYVQAGTVLATLLRREPMLLRFHVTTSEAPRIKVGMPVSFTLKESLTPFTANITLIAAAAEADSRLVPVTAEIVAEKKFWLRPGSFAMVKINLTPQRQFPMIPQTAARPSDRGFLAYTVDGNVVHEKVLTLGLHTSDGWVEVRDGLQVGDILVTKGLEALAEGTKVQVVSPGGSASGAGSGGPRGGRGPRGSGSGAASGEGRGQRGPRGQGDGAPSAAAPAGAP
ncbi:MAG: efflux RND transporter periplasmic adaptor subunit [Deltaproteobacteria bacterium]|nr:efflux RND transporter periplasmic adaptor subunit [Deltaproteobacteria bacterium]